MEPITQKDLDRCSEQSDQASKHPSIRKRLFFDQGNADLEAGGIDIDNTKKGGARLGKPKFASQAYQGTLRNHIVNKRDT